jgi:hypothetical protein
MNTFPNANPELVSINDSCKLDPGLLPLFRLSKKIIVLRKKHAP